MTPFSHIQDYAARMRAIAASYAYWLTHDCKLSLA
jgi:hypothetical protein